MPRTFAIVWSLLVACSPALPVVGARHPASPEAPAVAPRPPSPTLRPTASVDEVAPIETESAPPGGHAHHHGGHP